MELREARAWPKILLHDHLDGGLRPETILELAEEVGHALPSTEVSELVSYFRAGADSRDILKYLETFGHTIPLLQTPENLYRVAKEAAEDLAADGVIYAELRFAPELHVGSQPLVGSELHVGSQPLAWSESKPMGLDDAIEAVTSGFGDAVADPSVNLRMNTIICAMRTGDRSLDVANACARWMNRSANGQGAVVGFDLAGAETGFPPTDHLEALEVAKRAFARLTIHASEPPGLELISQALAVGAERIGHGVRLIEDCSWEGDELVLGSLASYVRDREIPLELCPSCNVQIGAVPTLGDHPIAVFLRAGIKATINTDNRLMSGVSASSELRDVATTHHLTRTEVGRLVANAVDASFADHDLKKDMAIQVLGFHFDD